MIGGRGGVSTARLCSRRSSARLCAWRFLRRRRPSQLGTRLALQRACLEGLSSGDAGFAIDFPSRTMLAIYKRLQIEVNATMIRYAKPLRVDRKVAGPRSGPRHRPRASLSRRTPPSDYATCACGAKAIGPSLPSQVHGERNSPGVAREWSSSVGVCVARTAEYLNWRYREHPLQKYEMLTARQGSRLRGYLIHHSIGEDWTIADLFAENDAARSVLLREATAVARKHGAHTVSVAWLATHPGRRLLEQRTVSVPANPARLS